MPLSPPSRSLRSRAAAHGLSLSSPLARSPFLGNSSGERSRSSVVSAVFKKKSKNEKDAVSYGRDWYESTRDPSRGLTPRQEMERRRRANWEANNGLERKDLYTDNWEGATWAGPRFFNVLTVILFVSVAVPALGLLFAWKTYGTLWG